MEEPEQVKAVKDPSKRKTAWTALTSWFPLAYAIITVIGFLDYYTTYSFYGINVGAYLTIGELILAFLPIITPLLLAAGAMGLIMAFALLFPPSRPNPAIDEVTADLPSVGDLMAYTNVRRQMLSNGGDVRGLERFLAYTMATISILSWIIFIGYPNILIYQYIEGHMYVDETGTFILSLFWCYLLVNHLATIFKIHKLRPDRMIFIGAALSGLMALGTVGLTNRNHGRLQLDGSQQVEATVLTVTDTIATNECLVYVGRIEAGVFLHDISTNSNRLIPATEIRSLTVENE